jgi:hypothetical protein
MQLIRWVAVLLLAAGCSGPPKPPTGPTPITPAPTPTPTPNNPPRIAGVIVSATRVEVGDQVTLTANVADDETAVDELKYEWTATAGAFVGTGRVVKWTAPTGVLTPATFIISLTVIDEYRSGQQTLEHRATAQSAQIVVEDPHAIVQALSMKFLANFADSKVTPEICIQDFSDSCLGKERERKDIVNNRKNYLILSWDVSITSVEVKPSRTEATVLAYCEFTSKKLTDGKDGPAGSVVVAKGICDLEHVYRSDRWWLCESSMHGLNTAGLHFIF